MKNSSNKKHEIHRREFIKGGAAISLGLSSNTIGMPNKMTSGNGKTWQMIRPMLI